MGNNEDKKRYILSYFRVLNGKISNLNELIKCDCVEEAITLALCYVDGMVGGEGKKGFIKAFYNYSGHDDLFSKISLPFLKERGVDVTEKDKNKEGNRIANYNDIMMVLEKVYGGYYDCRQETVQDEVIKHLKSELRNADWQNIETNLENFSYASYLWEYYRSCAVHGLGVMAPLICGKPLFERNRDGEDVYYYDTNGLCFSKEIILEAVRDISLNLEKKCMSEEKFPWELTWKE